MTEQPKSDRTNLSELVCTAVNYPSGNECNRIGLTCKTSLTCETSRSSSHSCDSGSLNTGTQSCDAMIVYYRRRLHCTGRASVAQLPVACGFCDHVSCVYKTKTPVRSATFHIPALPVFTGCLAYD